MPAPICLFVYRRPEHFVRTIEYLALNELASPSPIFIFSDGPKSPEAVPAVEEVRRLARSVRGFSTVTVIEREKNFGLSRSIIAGVTDIITRYGKVIVLEDDMITSRYFLQYMNDALDLYQNDERVISAHGYLLPVTEKTSETFFLRGADCWGWATWKHGWDLFEMDGRTLYDRVIAAGREREFDYNGSYGYLRMLWDQIRGKNDSWAIRWYASAFLRDKLTLHPGISLVQNIGNDASGTHCGALELYDTRLSDRQIKLGGIPVEHNQAMYRAFARVYAASRSRRKVAAINRNVAGFIRSLKNQVLGKRNTICP